MPAQDADDHRRFCVRNLTHLGRSKWRRPPHVGAGSSVMAGRATGRGAYTLRHAPAVRRRATLEPGVANSALEAYVGHVPPNSTSRTRLSGSEVTLPSKPGDSRAARDAVDVLASRPPEAGTVLPTSSTIGHRLERILESALSSARERLVHAALRLGDSRAWAGGHTVTAFPEPIVRRGASSPMRRTGTFGSHGMVFAD